jgi:hypothetical protein
LEIQLGRKKLFRVLKIFAITWRQKHFFKWYFFYQKSPSSKSRIKGYLLLVDRDPTTTTHRSHKCILTCPSSLALLICHLPVWMISSSCSESYKNAKIVMAAWK